MTNTIRISTCPKCSKEFTCEIRRCKTLEDMQDRPMAVKETLSSTNAVLLPSVYKALATLVTMPQPCVNDYSGEVCQHHEKAKYLNNYLCSTMNTERLLVLVLLHCYKTRQINVERVTDIFGGKKKRKLAILFHGICQKLDPCNAN